MWWATFLLVAFGLLAVSLAILPVNGILHTTRDWLIAFAVLVLLAVFIGAVAERIHQPEAQPVNSVDHTG